MASGGDSGPDARDAAAGLCPRCRHVAIQSTARGGRFYRCRRAEGDPRYARYPPLPVRTCPGYEPNGASRSR